MASGQDNGGRGAGASTGGSSPSNSLLDAALGYAARGWPVFPCSPQHKRPLLPADVDGAGKKIKGSGGLTKASIDPAQIRAWWKKWPSALIGLCTGHPTIDAAGLRLFVVDFDPRTDETTGEVWTLDRLKGETEAQIGCALPISLTALSPSDGVHLYLLQDDDGPAVNNRGNLPLHVDVRGLGGYVIAPPSVMGKDAIKGQGGLHYRWHRKEPIGGIAKAPAELLAELRAPKRKAAKGAAPANIVGSDYGRSPQSLPSMAESDIDAADYAGSGSNNAAADQAASSSLSSSARTSTGDVEEDAVRNYALHALQEECRLLAATPLGNRDNQSNASGFVIGQLVGAGALTRSEAEAALVAAVQGFGDPEARAVAIANGLDAGEGQKRDLSAVRASARERAARQGPRSRDPSHPTPHRDGGSSTASFRNGREAGNPDGEGDGGGPAAPVGAELERMKKVAAGWLRARLERVEREPKALKALAWGMGRRCAAGLLDEAAVKMAIWPLCEGEGAAANTMIVEHAEIDRSFDEGFAQGFDFGPLRIAFACALYPLTDKGNAMRFRDRFGESFRYTTTFGWLGWDGRRWKVLDQEKDVTPAEVKAAVFDTIDAIQREARLIAETGIKLQLSKDGKELDLGGEEDAVALDHYVLVGKQWKLFSKLVAAWGRASESAGRLGCIPNLALRWLTAPISAFDHDEYAVNVLNGTLRFEVETLPDGKRVAKCRLDRHRRGDLLTKLCPVEYDPEAVCPRYDAMLEWAQPELAMRRYLHQIGGFSLTGDAGEQKLWFWYGRGRNGKGTTIECWCYVAGDYSDSIPVESLLDQGIKKRGDAASPDLAKLGGVRMLRASEPERNAKLNTALIKFVTGGEPVPVRAMFRGFFNLVPNFKLIISGNSKFDIPDTDDGIWGRLKLTPWLRNIDKPEPGVENWPKKDKDLPKKIKALEGAGVLNRLVEGLMDYLTNGFIEPKTVTAATAGYRDASDPLARFLRLCTVDDPESRVQSSKLYDVFAAWARAAGETEWKQKGFSNAMTERGFEKKASDGMQWLGLKLVRSVDDFVDPETGKVKRLPDDMAAEPHHEEEDAPTPRPLTRSDYADEDP